MTFYINFSYLVYGGACGVPIAALVFWLCLVRVGRTQGYPEEGLGEAMVGMGALVFGSFSIVVLLVGLVGHFIVTG